MIVGHGDDTYRYDGITMNFSSNICYNADTAGLKAFLRERMDVIGSYPEPEAWRLERAIAAQRGVSAECVVVTAGAVDAIYLVAQALRSSYDRYIVPFRPTFSEYDDACRLLGYKEGDGGLCWICSPNNPTGEVLRGYANARMTIIDCSYEDYLFHHGHGQTDVLPDVVRVFSMTKSYGVPGLRLGYVIASEAMAARLRSFLRPWAVNALAIEAGLFLVERGIKGIPDIGGWLTDARELANGLSAIEGITVNPSETPFMMCAVSSMTAATLKEALAQRYGMLIRDLSNLRGANDHSFRICARSRSENEQLIDAIQTITRSSRVGA